MKKLTLISAICLAFLLTACSSSEKPAADSTSGVTGVAACDEYFVKVEKFLNNPNVPQATRDAYKQTLEQNRTAWKQAASTPQGKAQLETSCKAALESIKPALEQFGK